MTDYEISDICPECGEHCEAELTEQEQIETNECDEYHTWRESGRDNG